MQLFQRYHYHQIYKLFHTDFWLFEVSIWLHVLARAMISVFVPIFLLKMGWPVNHVIIFYLMSIVINVPLNFLAKWSVYKIGARRVVILGTVAYIALFVCLYNLTLGNWWLLAGMAACSALYDTFYWVGHIYFFMSCEKNQRTISKSLSLMYVAKQVACILAPLAGALILIFFTRDVLIIVSSIFLLLSTWPLFQIKDIEDRPKEKPKSMREFFQKGDGLREYVIQALYSFHNEAEGIIWPIFIYTLFRSVESVAMIPVIVSITTVIFTYFTGRIKKGNRGLVMALGAALVAVTWILRLSIVNNVFYYFTVFLIGLFSVLVSLPLDSDLLEKGRKKDALDAATYRNLFSMFPRAFLHIAILILLEVFKVSFVAAAASMFVVAMINLVLMRRPKAVGGRSGESSSRVCG